MTNMHVHSNCYNTLTTASYVTDVFMFSIVSSSVKGLQMYRRHLYDNLDFNVFGQAAEQSGFLEEGEGKRLAKLWQGDKEKAVSTLLEATEAKGPAGFGLFLSTLKCTLNVKVIDATTQKRHKVLLAELSRVEPCEITVTVSNTGDCTIHSTIT